MGDRQERHPTEHRRRAEEVLDLIDAALVESIPVAPSCFHAPTRDQAGKCWADRGDGTQRGCWSPAETEVGLCARHYEELTP